MKSEKGRVRVMIGSGENAIFVTKREGDRYILSDGTIVKIRSKNDKTVNERIDDIIKDKPKLLMKRLQQDKKDKK
jgi:hypothetical protein